MSTLKVYVLPESYEVKNKTLDDIKYVVNPTYTRPDVAKLDKEVVMKWDLGKKKYIPGFVGLNNIKANDYLNVVAHALGHVPPLRNYLMLEDLSSRPELAQRFSTLVRKIWNSSAFKSHVSPHELLQEISLRSNKKFTLLSQSDPVDFLHWFLNNLHLSLGGSKTRPNSSIIQRVFQGSLKMESQLITAKADASDRLRFEEAGEIKTQISRFLMLTLDLPPKPIFKDEQDKNIIPQIPLTTIMNKYDGLHPQELLGQRRRYRLLNPLPPYLMFHIKRFAKNKFVEERNPTIVTFSPRALDMAPYVEPDAQHSGGEPLMYDLIANITHETVVETGKKEGELGSVFKVQLLEKARGQWMQIQDLFVEEVARELLFTSESYVQIWERRRDMGKGKGKGKA
jgi:U4/U6.U5 tri-snRNP-associated protein 2